MNYSLAIFLINEDVRALEVEYTRASNEYGTIYSPSLAGVHEVQLQHKIKRLVKTLDQTIKKDDFVVIEATAGALLVAKVVDDEPEVDFDSNVSVPWVAQRIDMADFEDISKQEADAIKQIKRARVRDRREELASSLLKSKGMDRLAIGKRKGFDD